MSALRITQKVLVGNRINCFRLSGGIQFGFAQRTSQGFAKPKEPNLPTLYNANYSMWFLLHTIISFDINNFRDDQEKNPYCIWRQSSGTPKGERTFARGTFLQSRPSPNLYLE